MIVHTSCRGLRYLLVYPNSSSDDSSTRWMSRFFLRAVVPVRRSSIMSLRCSLRGDRTVRKKVGLRFAAHLTKTH